MTIAELDARVVTVSATEAANRLGLEPGTLANWRWDGSGPCYCKVGGRIRYRLADLADFLDRQTRRSTSDAGPSRGKPSER